MRDNLQWRVHGDKQKNIRGTMQTHDNVVSDEPRVGKIKPLIIADLHGAGDVCASAGTTSRPRYGQRIHK